MSENPDVVPAEIPVSARHDPRVVAEELYDQERALRMVSGHWRDLSMVGPIPINVAQKAVMLANTRFINVGKLLVIVPQRRVVKRDADASDDGYLESNLTVFRLFLHEVQIK